MSLRGAALLTLLPHQCSHKPSKFIVTSEVICGRPELQLGKHASQTTVQICLQKGAWINPYINYFRSCFLFSQTCDSEQERQEIALTKIETIDEKNLPLSQDYFKPVANKPLAPKPQVMYLWMTLLYLPKEQYKNKAKILGIYSGF